MESIFISLIVGVGNIPRNHTSLIIILLLFYVLLRISNDMRKGLVFKKEVIQFILTICLSLFMYKCFTNLIPTLYANHTNRESILTNMPAWHTVYISYGFEDNPYGIIFSDKCAADFVNSKNPDVQYLSQEYFDILYTELKRMWISNPAYFFFSYIRKALYSIIYASKSACYSWIIFFAGLYYLLKKGMCSNIIKFGIMLGLLSFVFNLIFPLIAYPFYYSYLMGMICSVHFLAMWILMNCVYSILNRKLTDRS